MPLRYAPRLFCIEPNIKFDMQTNVMIEQIERGTLLNLFEGIASSLNAIKGKITPPVETVFLTTDEVAEKLKVSKVTVWSWTKAGILKSYRIGNQVRYIEDEVIRAATAKAMGKGATQQ